MSPTTGTACRRRASLRDFEAKWADRTQSAQFQRRLALPRAAAVRAARAGADHRRGADHPPAGRQRRRLRRHATGQAVPAIRGTESVGQLQGQRHDGGVHARPHGRRPPGRLRQHRQHQRLAGRLLLRHRPDAGHHLHRQRQNLLRQAGPGARSRRPDRADRRRLRRRHAARAAGQPPAGHLSRQQHQPLPPGRTEDDHVPRAGGAALGGAGLDRRARRQSRQRQRLRQGVHRVGRTGPAQALAASGGHQRRRREHVFPAVRATQSSLGGRQAGETDDRGLLSPAWTPSSSAPRRSPAPSRSIGR